jgi:hypothetical protein
MVERCPTCGAPVEVVSGGEGTSHYEPADDNDVGAELSRIEADMLDIHDALEDAGLPGAINADSIIERIAAMDKLRADRDAIREAARRLLGAHQANKPLVPYLVALEDACGFWQQGDPPRRREPSDG